MCSRDMDRWIHFNMAIVGGFLGGFAILNHHELFGSAQTSNLISVFADFAGHPDANFIVRLIGVFYLYVCIVTDCDLTKIYKTTSSLCQSFYRCNGSLDRCFSSIGSE